MEKLPTFVYHYFLDEAGDPNFYGKGKMPIVGQNGVSNCFYFGYVEWLVRQTIIKKIN